MKQTRNKLVSSIVTLCICMAMLIGSTYAWFTDTASSGINKIQAGNLDVDLQHFVVSDYVSVDANTKLFTIADNTKWEPGVVVYEKIRVVNNGNLALKYTLGFLPTNVTTDSEGRSLLDVIKVYSGTSIDVSSRDTVLASIGSISGAKLNEFSDENVKLNARETKDYTFVLYWEPTANDNDYNKPNRPFTANIGLNVIATQAEHENDSFGNTYDASALYPTSARVTVELNSSNETTAAAKATSTNKVNGKPAVTVEIPAGTKLQGGVTEVETTVKETSLPAGATISATSNAKTFEISTLGLASDNEQLLTVTVNIGAGLGDVTLTHFNSSGTATAMNKKNSPGEVTADQDYYYDNTNGEVTFKTKSFSPFVVEYPKPSWTTVAEGSLNETEAGEYIIQTAKDMATFAKMVNDGVESFNGKTVKLDADINLDGYLWEPVGQTGRTQFMGTFDGGNHTISNLLINNTDESGNCSSGLFGWLNNATVKNLKIDTATVTGHHNVGVVAGYLETTGCTIENVHVTNATVSCTGVNNDANGDKCGGIVGHAGNAGVKVNNCTVTNSTISAGRDAGQVVGAALEANITGCSATNVEVTANGTSSGANIRNKVIGRLLP